MQEIIHENRGVKKDVFLESHSSVESFDFQFLPTGSHGRRSWWSYHLLADSLVGERQLIAQLLDPS